jgi:hypothetical protein
MQFVALDSIEWLCTTWGRSDNLPLAYIKHPQPQTPNDPSQISNKPTPNTAQITPLFPSHNVTTALIPKPTFLCILLDFITALLGLFC